MIGCLLASRNITSETITLVMAMPSMPEESLDAIVSFANTIDIEAGTDRLRTPEGLLGWLMAHGLASPDSRIGLEDLADLVGLRNAMRELISAQGGKTPSPTTLEALRRASAEAAVTISTDRVGTVQLSIRPSSDASVAKTHLLMAIMHAQESGAWRRLSICQNPGCGWVFYDRSKNRSRRWCDMAVCGNRAKAARYRSRRNLTGPSGSADSRVSGDLA